MKKVLMIAVLGMSFASADICQVHLKNANKMSKHINNAPRYKQMEYLNTMGNILDKAYKACPNKRDKIAIEGQLDKVLVMAIQLQKKGY